MFAGVVEVFLLSLRTRRGSFVALMVGEIQKVKVRIGRIIERGSAPGSTSTVRVRTIERLNPRRRERTIDT
jgi:hypothetical protein